MPSVKPKWIKPAGSQADHSKALVRASAAISADDIVVVSGVQGARMKCRPADADNLLLGGSTLMVAKHAIPSGRDGAVLPWKVLTGVVTTGSSIGAPIFLSATAGGWALLPDCAEARIVGEVLSVGVSGAVVLNPMGGAWGSLQSQVGPQVKRIIKGEWDFATDGGAVSAINLRGAYLPDNARVIKSWYEVLTTCTSGGGDAGTMSVDIPTDDAAGLFAATAISTGTTWDATGAAVDMIQDGAAANFSEVTTAARQITVTIATQAFTAGKILFFFEYVVTA